MVSTAIAYSKDPDMRPRIPATPLKLAKFSSSPIGEEASGQFSSNAVGTLVNQSPSMGSPQVCATPLNLIELVNNNQ